MRSPRRYYLLKRLSARAAGKEDGVWIALQQQHVGTDLPSTFPARAALIAVGYSTVEDVDGASTAELQRFARINRTAAEAAIAAAAAL